MKRGDFNEKIKGEKMFTKTILLSVLALNAISGDFQFVERGCEREHSDQGFCYQTIKFEEANFPKHWVENEEIECVEGGGEFVFDVTDYNTEQEIDLVYATAYCFRDDD